MKSLILAALILALPSMATAADESKLFKDTMLTKSTTETKYAYCSGITKYHANMALYSVIEFGSNPDQPPSDELFGKLGTVFLMTDHASKMFEVAALQVMTKDKFETISNKLAKELEAIDYEVSPEQLSKHPAYSLVDDCLEMASKLGTVLSKEEIDQTLNKSKEEFNAFLKGE